MLHSPYVRCPACRILVFDPELKLAALDTPAPCCGARGASRGIWPGLQALKLLEIAESQDQQQPEGHRITVLFFASALEVMLEDVLVELLQQHTSSEALSEAVLDSHQGIERRRDLFRQLAGTSLGDLLREDWGREFLLDWKTLAARRNKVAHGSYYYRGSEDMVTVHRMRNSYFPAFAEMHNHVTRHAATPRE
jgi:hypothetical protein